MSEHIAPWLRLAQRMAASMPINSITGARVPASAGRTCVPAAQRTQALPRQRQAPQHSIHRTTTILRPRRAGRSSCTVPRCSPPANSDPAAAHPPPNGGSSRRRRSVAAPLELAGGLGLPISILTDSYKASHFLQYPEARKMVAVRRVCPAAPHPSHHTAHANGVHLVTRSG